MRLALAVLRLKQVMQIVERKFVAFVTLSLVFVPMAHASCPGMSGDALERCECLETSFLVAPDEDRRCQTNADCIALESTCGEWLVSNKDSQARWRQKIGELAKRKHFPGARTSKPEIQCYQNKCMTRHQRENEESLAASKG